MKNSISILPLNSGYKITARFWVYLFISAVISACSGTDTPESAKVQSVANAQVLEGNSGTALLEFVVTLDSLVAQGLDVSFSTLSTAKTGIDSTGSAKGGTSCALAGTDFVSASNSKVSIPKGSKTATLTVTVCGDSTFEPNETLKITWTAVGSVGGSAIGTIVNDDAGGLNSIGATTGMGGAAFGRDVNPLTNTDADGVLGFSFDKTDPACTLDEVTGLSWQRTVTTGKSYANLQSIVDAANAGDGVCLEKGWRVPTVNELFSLVNFNVAFPGRVNADAMTTDAEVMAGEFWSSESVANAPDNAWFMSANNGGAVSFETKTSTRSVRLVRGTPTLSACDDRSRYNDFGDGTVEDLKTGLMWMKCPVGASGASCNSTPPYSSGTDNDIVAQLNFVNGGTDGSGSGYSNWRIPTVKELASLVDRCVASSPAISSGIFPNNQSISYISATYDANSSEPQRRYWIVEFGQGAISVASPLSKYLRLVRAGQ
jgi:hypothetical protein